MQNQSFYEKVSAIKRNLYYGWVIVIASALLIAITYGLMYGYAVYFKPLADYFKWDRASVSLIYSVSMVIRGAVAIGIGWLADRYGPKLLMIFCGFMILSGLILSSQVKEMWQLYITYGIIESIGLSGAYVIGTSITTRWFTEHRGLALGIVSTGSGFGTLFIVPGIERIINVYDWSQTFIITGIAGGIITIALALLLHSPPKSKSKLAATSEAQNKKRDSYSDTYLLKTLKDPRMILLMISFFFFFFSVQIVMVHLVNYATDMGITPLIAATFISVIGAVSIISRLATGTGSDKLGIQNIMILTRIFLIIAFVCLIFSHTLPTFYLFAILFSLPYGGEVPQIPLFIGKYFGIKSIATLVGINLFIITVGGAFGSWIAGLIFDNTGNYEWAFIAGALAGAVSLISILILRAQSVSKNNITQEMEG